MSPHDEDEAKRKSDLREIYSGIALHAILSRGDRTPEEAAGEAVRAAEALIAVVDAPAKRDS